MRWTKGPFTVRRLIAVVAASALLLGFVRAVPWQDFIDFFADDPFHAISTTRKTWDLGDSPWIDVDLFQGSIKVIPSDDGKVHADITCFTITKQTQSAADRALASIDLDFDHRGDSLRIKARGALEPGIRSENHLVLRVPAGVRLDLRTGLGCIYVGREYLNGTLVHKPVVARSIRARNDSAYQLGYASGNITIETLAPRGEGGVPIPTRLQLDAVGQIEITADLAIVEARAWHGKLPEQWRAETPEHRGSEGTILFDGGLAEGEHSFRAAHSVDFKLANTGSIRVDAQASGGAITGDLIPQKVEPTKGEATWSGTVGEGPRGILRLRSEDGPINLDRKP